MYVKLVVYIIDNGPRMRGRSHRTPKDRARFLEALQKTANVSSSCQIAGLSRSFVYDWRAADAEFAADWAAAIELGCDALEDEAVRRGCEGWVEPVFHRGKEVGAIREYSDTLLIFMLKARRPARFRDNYVRPPQNGGNENAIVITGGLSQVSRRALRRA
jgi:hypothetical protein